MENDKIALILNKVGSILAQDKKYPLNEILLYAEVLANVVNSSIFKDLGDHFLYRWTMPDLVDALLDLWETAPENQRWSAIIYQIDSLKFDASFLYPDDIDPLEDSMDRRERILKQRRGDKRIQYPSLPM